MAENTQYLLTNYLVVSVHRVLFESSLLGTSCCCELAVSDEVILGLIFYSQPFINLVYMRNHILHRFDSAVFHISQILHAPTT